MRHFKDIDTIRSATAEELEQVPQMNRKAAESVYLSFISQKRYRRTMPSWCRKRKYMTITLKCVSIGINNW